MNAIKHWRWQRYSAAVLFFLLPWLLYELTFLHQTGGFSSEMIRHWLSQPMQSIGVLVTFTVSLYHGKLGMEVIIEDYVPNQSMQKIIIRLLTVVICFCWVLLFFAIISNLSF